MKTIHYINLTSGVEAIPELSSAEYAYFNGICYSPINISDWHFLRIQSTACEQKRWEYILSDLDNDFLMNLALGNKCVIHDYSAHKTCPRSIFQGLEWIKFSLEWAWFDHIGKVNIRGDDCTTYFAKELFKIKDGATMVKLKYFRKFLNTDKLNIETIVAQTKHDGDIEFHKDILKKFNT